jgi:hypothetical protein
MDRPESSVAGRDARLAALAGEVIALAQQRLGVLPEGRLGFDHAVAVVDAAVSGLDELSRRADCTDQANRWLVDWRDRLGSYLHAARALADVRIDTDVARHLLHRGVDDIGLAIAIIRWEGVAARF